MQVKRKHYLYKTMNPVDTQVALCSQVISVNRQKNWELSNEMNVNHVITPYINHINEAGSYFSYVVCNCFAAFRSQLHNIFQNVNW
jgi:hypothetical protein